MESLGAVAHDGKTAALSWPVFGKSCDDYMASGLHGPKGSLDVGVAILVFSQKVEDRSIVPKVEGVGRKLCLCNVRFKPSHLARARSETSLRSPKRRRGKIEHCNI